MRFWLLNKMKSIFLFLIIVILVLVIVLIWSKFFIPDTIVSKIKWGVSFSQKQSEALGLDWRENYLAILNDLKVKFLRISVHWDLIEPIENQYDFSDLDWQINKAREAGAQIILAIGMKTPRWPECHLPDWANNLSPEKQQERVNNLIREIVLRYKDEETIVAWQIENEPFFPFGECPKRKKGFLNEEIKIVKSLDNRKIITTDSGEWSFWIKTAKRGDVFGISLYRRVWSTTFSFLHKIFPFIPDGFYLTYPFPPEFYSIRVKILEKLLNKKVIVAELQAEPWNPVATSVSLQEEQKKTMDLEKFKEMINFAQKTGLDEFYLWGAEWWYWLKTKQNNLLFWEEAKKLFIN